MSASRVESAFAVVPLLGRLSVRQRSRLAGLATNRSYPAGSMIVRQGDTSMAFYIILSGSVRIERQIEGRASMVVSEIGPTGFFGEMGLIDDQPRAATVVALEPTECALLAKWDFQNELRHDSAIALGILPVLTRRIRELDERLAKAELVVRRP
jgi:CRP/FNR family cyclic AMP-dependent transcriptional regulator